MNRLPVWGTENERKPLCNGEANGKQCKHYWVTVQPVNVENSEDVKKGEVTRHCNILGRPDRFTFTHENMPTYCNKYARRWFGGSYNKELEEYDVTLIQESDLTEEELERLRMPVAVTAADSLKSFMEEVKERAAQAEEEAEKETPPSQTKKHEINPGIARIIDDAVNSEEKE